MAGRKLNANTVVANPETGAPEVLLEGTTPPGWAADLIGDHLYGSGSAAATAAPGTTTGAPPRSGKGSGRDAWAAYAATVDGVEVTEEMKTADIIAAVDEALEPPRGGDGSDRDAWVAYAGTVGVEVNDDMGRDEIIAAVDAAKK